MEICEYNINKYKSKKVSIYGATVGGNIIYQHLTAKGVKVECFYDRKHAGEKFCGILVKNPEDIEKDEMIINVLTRSFDSAVQTLQQLELSKMYISTNLIKEIDIKRLNLKEDEIEVANDFLKNYSIYANGINSLNFILPALEVFITEKCTLRCRDCSHLIPYYTNREHYDLKRIIDSLENVLKVVTYIEDLIILGGEPFLYPDLIDLLVWGDKKSKIGKMTIISNGTVMPSNKLIEIMKATGTRIRISNYGKHSIKLDEIRRVCEEKEISCFINNEEWIDMGKIENHHYSIAELKEIFEDCPFAFDMLLLKGRLYRCAHIAHLFNLGKVSDEKKEYVDFTELTEEQIERKKIELEEYLHCEYLQTCTYCKGIKNSIKGIEPAIQLRDGEKNEICQFSS